MLLVWCINFNYVACHSALLRNLMVSPQYSKYFTYLPENYYIGHFLCLIYIYIYIHDVSAAVCIPIIN